MAVAFPILIALLASPGQSGAVTTTDSSSLSAKQDVFAPSQYLSHKHNYTTAFVAGEQAYSRVSVTRSGVATVAALNTNKSGGAQTARGTTHALNWLVRTVTNASEITETVDTVPGLVHLENDSDDIPSETVLTSLATTTTTTAVPGTVAFPCPRSPVTSVKECEVMLCEKNAGYFVINITNVLRERDLRSARQYQPLSTS